MSKFKVGDRVRCVDDMGGHKAVKKGREYTVAVVYDDQISVAEVYGMYFNTRFEPIQDSSYSGEGPQVDPEWQRMCERDAQLAAYKQDVNESRRRIAAYEPIEQTYERRREEIARQRNPQRRHGWVTVGKHCTWTQFAEPDTSGISRAVERLNSPEVRYGFVEYHP